MKIRNLYYLFILAAASSLMGCEKNLNGNLKIDDEKYFYEQINIENNLEKFNLGDTIWFSADFSNELPDAKSGALINFENQTFILHSTINLLDRKFDSISFIYQNFDLIAEVGDIQIINVLNSEYESYTFDIRFGRPLITNEIRFGVIANYEGIFSFENEGWVFYGIDRDDYYDYSVENGKGFIDISFYNDDINDSIYYALPASTRYDFQNYYTSREINSKKYYFFEVDGE